MKILSTILLTQTTHHNHCGSLMMTASFPMEDTKLFPMRCLVKVHGDLT